MAKDYEVTYDQVQEYMVYEKDSKRLLVAQAHARVLAPKVVKEAKKKAS